VTAVATCAIDWVAKVFRFEVGKQIENKSVSVFVFDWQLLSHHTVVEAYCVFVFCMHGYGFLDQRRKKIGT